MDRVIMFGMTAGEAFVVAFVVTTVVSAPWWPRLGEALLAGPRREASDPVRKADDEPPPG